MKTKFSRIDAALDEILFDTRLISDTLWETGYYKEHMEDWEMIEYTLRLINDNARAMSKDGKQYAAVYNELRQNIAKAIQI